MSVINILSPHLADLIAAGEVVERPASVIKELVENALDAGAKNITVEISSKSGAYIRVSDDGCGMSAEDAGIAFLRHATSKLRDEAGLSAIGTMGFRGEALAAISSVSKIELSTRRHGDSEGTKVLLEAGEIQDMLPCGCPEGTTMVVRELFYNTPARLKFMKSDRSEASACTLSALRCALGHPEVSVRFIKDGAEEFFSPGDGRSESCIYTLLGRDMASSLLRCGDSEEGISLEGFTSSPSNGRGNRGMQFFFCNGRFIKSQLLQTAVEQAYKNTLLTGRYPACVLYLTMDSASVDVNVHPAKTEVKFSFEKKIFDLVYRAVTLALRDEVVTAKPELSASTLMASEPKKDFFRSMDAKSFRENGFKATSSSPQNTLSMRSARSDYAVKSSAPASPTPFEKSLGEMSVYKKPAVTTTSFQDSKIKAPAVPSKMDKDDTKIAPPDDRSDKAVDNYVENVDSPPPSRHKIVGEVLKTYIIVESDGQLVLIDKHAAHERMIFDRLKREKREICAQTLLIPATVKLAGEDAELVESKAQLLYELGFEIEPYGDNSYIIRTVPADMDSGDASAAIEEICEKLKRGKGLDIGSMQDEILHTVACKAAIKAGWDTHEKELERLVEEVMSGRVKYCPHGRPVAVTITRKELDKLFKRIV